jgi:hypothetical protein
MTQSVSAESRAVGANLDALIIAAVLRTGDRRRRTSCRRARGRRGSAFARSTPTCSSRRIGLPSHDPGEISPTTFLEPLRRAPASRRWEQADMFTPNNLRHRLGAGHLRDDLPWATYRLSVADRGPGPRVG